MTKQTYIEVNGKRYDARTGKLMDVVAQPTAAPKVVNPTNLKRHTSTEPRQLAPATSRTHQKSHTLMRTAVKKPPTKKPAPTAASSTLISKFGTAFAAAPIKPRVEPVMMSHHQEELKALAKSKSPTETSPHSRRPADDLVSKALAASTSHTQKKHPLAKKKKLSTKLGLKPKTARYSSAVLATLILGVFFAYQNIPNFAMRVAATRAGFDARMPGYHPSGFGYRGPVQYRSGEVIVHYGSNTSDGREFAVTQRASSWNNDALLANFVLNNDSQYQTYQDGNKTIYLYDNNNATWVSDGVWYQLEGNAELTTDQISRLANSL